MALKSWLTGKDPYQVEKDDKCYSANEVIRKLKLDGNNSQKALNQLMNITGVDFRWQGKMKVIKKDDFDHMSTMLSQYKKKVNTRYWKLALIHGNVLMAYNAIDEFSVSRGVLMKTAKSLNISAIHEGKVIFFKEKDYYRLKEHFESKKEKGVHNSVARKAIDILKRQKEDNVVKGLDHVVYKDPKYNIDVYQTVPQGTSEEEKESLKEELERNEYSNLMSDFKTRVYKLENDIQAQAEIINDKNFLLEKNKEKIESLERKNLDLTKKVSRLMEDLKGLSKLRNAISVLMNEGLKNTQHSYNQHKYIERDFFED